MDVRSEKGTVKRTWFIGFLLIYARVETTRLKPRPFLPEIYGSGSSHGFLSYFIPSLFF